MGGGRWKGGGEKEWLPTSHQWGRASSVLNQPSFPAFSASSDKAIFIKKIPVILPHTLFSKPVCCHLVVVVLRMGV